MMTEDIFPQIEPISFDEFNERNFNKVATIYKLLFTETVYESSTLDEYIESLERQLKTLRKINGDENILFSISIYEDNGYRSEEKPTHYEVKIHQRTEKKIQTRLEEVERKYEEYLINNELANSMRKSDSERHRKHLIWLEENKQC